MPKISGKDLGELYPQPKSYDQLQDEQRSRMAQRRPQFVELKVSSWVSLAFVIVLTAYNIGYAVVANNLSSPGAVVFAVCSSLLLVLIAGSSAWYIYSLVDGLISKVLVSTSAFYGALLLLVGTASVVLVSFASNGWIIKITVLLVLFVISYYSTNFLIKREK